MKFTINIIWKLIPSRRLLQFVNYVKTNYETTAINIGIYRQKGHKDYELQYINEKVCEEMLFKLIKLLEQY